MSAVGVRRPRAGRVIGGVCAALGHEAGVDPVAVRIAAVVLAALGAGLPLYLIAWAALPGQGAEPRRLRPDRPIRALTALIVAALAGGLVAGGSAAVLAEVTGVDSAGDIGPALFLILLGLGALWWREAGVGGAVPAPAPAAGPGAAPAPVPAAAPRPRTAVDVLFAPLVVLLAGLVAFAPAYLPGRWGSEIGADQALAAAVLVMGLGLVAGAFLRRGAWIIPFGVLAAVLLAVITVAGVDFRGGTGERILAPESAAAVPAEFQLAAGTADIDLRRLRLEGQSVRLDARIAAGQMTVRLPPEAAVVLHARSGFGQIAVTPGERSANRLELAGDAADTTASGGRAVSGINVEADIELDGPDGRIEIDAEVGFGEIEVTW